MSVISARLLNLVGIFKYESPIQNFTEICPVGVKLFHAERYDEATNRYEPWLCENAEELEVTQFVFITFARGF